ncbi:hypothetical protein CXIVA_13790 [Clostridium sp. SY8519]|uniref:metal ABC transporter permease n=1 Tax=Clostridium sp. (strain SY8519) TaxID=1042156 RepID=UPI000217205D|nr:metal ABC transporter permease [Clostridium sp. SY8519]BAK47345.1 hypothetical protein CXIVA_13790 [Clostridium sp. SY8519]
MAVFQTLFTYDFMRLAFLAILIITPLFGILGTMVVSDKMAYFSDALGHSALCGMAVGVLFGVANTTVSLMIFGVLFALLLNLIRSKSPASTDTIISVLSSSCIAVGLIILSRNGNFSKYSSLLIGDVLSITRGEVIGLFLIFLATLVFWILCFNQLQAVSLHPVLAKSRGFRVAVIENLFTAVIALVVMLSIKWIGILIINALLILPPAASRNISENVREYHLFAVIFSVFSGLLGLVISYFANVATGPTIIVIAAVIFFATYIFGRNR